MKAEGAALSCLIVYLVVCTCTAQKIIPAEVGQDVTLPCKVPNINNKTIVALEWIKPGLEPDYVLLYRDGRIDPDSQHQSYKNRTYLQDKEMKDGNFSLVLKNVTKNDTGIYECCVFEEGNNESISNITLEVVLSGDQDGVIGGSVGGGLLAVAFIGFIVFLIYKRYKRQNPNHSARRDDEAERIPMSTLSGSSAEPTPPSAPLMDPAAEEQTAASPQETRMETSQME